MPKGWDHDPPAKVKLIPFGILMVATGALMLLFGSRDTSDAWVDALKLWWLQVREGVGRVKRLVIYLDNGPKNSGRRTQSLKRMVEFADWSGLEVRLVYYPPYHSKYNPIERCWGVLEVYWNGELLDSEAAVTGFAGNMTYAGKHPHVYQVQQTYSKGVRRSKDEMKSLEQRMVRLEGLPKWFVTIAPPKSDEIILPARVTHCPLLCLP